VIAIDRPGFGHSDRPRHRVWTAAAQARLLHGVPGTASGAISPTSARRVG
jgi:pimeloyl-ACP methyl ester carboxylesterase